MTVSSARGARAGNLLVDEDLSVRVADFGLSRVTHDLNTLTGGLGTFQYMAPEVMANQRYSVKADVYSFGVVLWECTARQVGYLLNLLGRTGHPLCRYSGVQSCSPDSQGVCPLAVPEKGAAGRCISGEVAVCGHRLVM